MKYIHELKEKLCQELDEIARRDISAGDLDAIHKLSDTIKNLDKIQMLESEYSNDGGASYRRHRDSMGRYSRDRDEYSQGYSRDSYHDGRDRMKQQLQEMMREAGSDREKRALMAALSEIG